VTFADRGARCGGSPPARRRLARAGIGVAGVRAYFSADNMIKLTNDNATCDVTYRVSGKVAV
jgi:hypothetical protein